MIQNFKLIEKKNKTHNVFEMIFEWEKELVMKPWQFITFLLDNIWWRAYSILELDWKKVKLIIKKREQNEWGRWWSKFICELETWEILKWVWPAWHFLLQENNKDKLFIWTGTGLAPLYNQIKWALNNKNGWKLKLIFWLREENDIFYLEELKQLTKNHNNFDFEIFLSRSDIEWINKWYTTDYITEQNCNKFDEFYICWAPAMIESSIEKLNELWIDNKNIFYEKY